MTELFELMAKISYPMWLIVLTISMAGLGLIAQSALYAKAGLPAVASLVPIWNVFVFLEVVGRPKIQSLWLLVPGTIMMVLMGMHIDEFVALLKTIRLYQTNEITSFPWSNGPIQNLYPLFYTFAGLGVVMFIYMSFVWVDVAKSFGKTKTSDFVYIIAFNGFYLINLGLSQVIDYIGPAYKFRKDGIPMPKEAPSKKKKKKAKTVVRPS